MNDSYRGRHAARPGDGAQPAVPPQTVPMHDTLPVGLPAGTIPEQRSAPAATVPTYVPVHAEWSEAARGRWIVNLLLSLLVLGTLCSLAMTVETRAWGWAVALFLCSFGTVMVRGTMIGGTRSIVRLDGTSLSVRHGRKIDVFDLADTDHPAETVGTPGDARWRLRLETTDGRVVELGPRQVDAEVLHHAVRYHRTQRTVPEHWRLFRG